MSKGIRFTYKDLRSGDVEVRYLGELLGTVKCLGGHMSLTGKMTFDRWAAYTPDGGRILLPYGPAATYMSRRDAALGLLHEARSA